jgi:transcriptional regulator with XRE-family HTH domain
MNGGWVTQAEIGRRVRALRQARGWSQETLAFEATRIYREHAPDGARLTTPWIIRLESAATRVVDLEKLAAVAAALDVPLSQLLLPDTGPGDPWADIAAALRRAGMPPGRVAAWVARMQRAVADQGAQRGDAARQARRPSDAT